MTRAVTSPTDERPRGDMSVVGYVVAAGSLLLLLPLVPFLALFEVVDRLTGSEPESPDGSDES